MLLLLLTVLRNGRRRRVDQPVVELAPFVGRQANGLVSGHELGSFPIHFHLVAHQHHQMGAFLGRPEYAPGGRHPLSVALYQPSFGRRLLPVAAVHVGQHHNGRIAYARVCGLSFTPSLPRKCPRCDGRCGADVATTNFARGKKKADGFVGGRARERHQTGGRITRTRRRSLTILNLKFGRSNVTVGSRARDSSTAAAAVAAAAVARPTSGGTRPNVQCSPRPVLRGKSYDRRTLWWSAYEIRRRREILPAHPEPTNCRRGRLEIDPRSTIRFSVRVSVL